MLDLNDISVCSATHLPIVKEYGNRMGLVKVIDDALDSNMQVSPGKIVMGLIMNILSTRSPLYLVEEFFNNKDVPLLLGEALSAAKFNDDAIGRVLDSIYGYGTWKLFSEIVLETYKEFKVDCSIVHQDTTSVSVWGEYEPKPDDTLKITFGHSKDKQPDLKQFVISLLCVEGNLPLRKGRIKKVWEQVFGFKIWVVWDSASSLPLALRFATIETADLTLAKEVILQACANLGSHATLASVTFDRGFTDGALWWWLHHELKILFFVPAKSNMHVYHDALASVHDGIRQTRERSRTVGHGRNKATVVDRWDVVGITGLTSAGFYGPLGSGSHEHAKDFVANPINAVVVCHDPFREKNPTCDAMVLLTNAPVEKPLTTYDSYDRRSDIENSLFREGKQAWFLQRPARMK